MMSGRLEFLNKMALVFTNTTVGLIEAHCKR
jgi:hypothetical protein